MVSYESIFMLFISLLNNITLLITLSIIHTFLLRYLKREQFTYQVLSGILFGVVAITGMINSVEIQPGLIFDGRSIILVTSGIFGGPLAVLIAILLSGAYRLYLGGPGVLMGILVIAESGFIGVILYFLREKYPFARRLFMFFVAGLLVHIVMLILTATLPGGLSKEILPQIFYPVLLIYPVATYIVCLMFHGAERNLIMTVKLKESERTFRMLAENAHDLIYRYEFIPERKFTYVSPSSLKITGYSPEEHYADPDLGMKLVYEDDTILLQSLVSGQKGFDTPIVLRWKRKSGEVIWTEQKNTAIHDKRGRLIAIEGIARDISEQMRSEMVNKVLYNIASAVLVTQDVEKLISVIRTELGTLMDTENFYIAFYDKNTGLLSAPYTRDEKDQISVWPAEKSLTGRVVQNKESLLVTRKEVYEMYERDEIKLIGTVAECWLGVPMYANEKVIGAFVVQSYTNPEAYTQKDEEMLTFISGQVSLSIQRQKAFEELKTALARAEESDHLKTAFLNNLSHEVRTPLNAIVGFSGLLNRPETEGQTVEHYVDIIQKSSDQLLSIIDSIFDIATIEANQVRIFERMCNLNDVLKTLERQFSIKIPPGVEFKINPGLDIAKAGIITDETKLYQIFNNLVGNAIKFTARGKVEIGYKIERGYVQFYVLDTGIGITKDKQSVIFEKFRQADPSIAREYGGTGLGLYIAKSYVEKLGGKIWLESSPITGTVFYFTIPHQPVSIKHEGKSLPEIPELDEKKTILIAEDDEMNFKLAAEMLKGMGLNILHARNGKEAIEISQSRDTIDLILMDIKMPVADGFEALKQIRKTRKDLPIIALTAFAMAGDKEKILAKGFDDYLPKPIKIDVLVKKIFHFIGSS